MTEEAQISYCDSRLPQFRYVQFKKDPLPPWAGDVMDYTPPAEEKYSYEFSLTDEEAKLFSNLFQKEIKEVELKIERNNIPGFETPKCYFESHLRKLENLKAKIFHSLKTV
jgi:hypothetical protein